MRGEGNRRLPGRLPKTDWWMGVVLLAVSFLAALLLTTKITVYCDDYFYGIFFRDGWKKFWELTTWHYLNFNGRAFVHFVAEVVLIFDTKLFVLLNPLMLAWVFLMGGRLQSRRTPWQLLILTGAIGILAVLALPVEYLNTSILWISAAFNYLFPVAFLLLAFWRCQRDVARKKLHPLTMVLVFLAGATTEQSGVAAVVCLGGWGILCWLRKKIPAWQGFLPAALACAGYLTVILAPGTWVRIGNETGGGILAFLRGGEILDRFRLAMQYLTGTEGLPVLFLVFCLLVAGHAFLTHRAPRILLGTPVLGVLYLLLWVGGHPFLAEVLSVVCFLLVAGVYLLQPRNTPRGLLLLGMLAAQMIMLVNTSTATRTTVPAILLLLTVCASLLAECMECFPRWSAFLVTVAAMVVLLPLFLPTYQGYAANAQITKANETALWEKTEDPIVLNLNIDETYAHLMYYVGASYLENAMDYYGITTEKISYTGSPWDVAGLYNGSRSGLPAFRADGEVFLPIQNVAQLCGGDGEWDLTYDGTVAWIGETCYFFGKNSEVYAWDREKEEPYGQVIYSDVRAPWYTAYAPASLLEELFGFTVTYDQGENIYYIQKEGTP